MPSGFQQEKILRPFAEVKVDDYFCIKQILQLEFTNEKSHKLERKVGGLGSDNRVYIYTPKGWKEL